jgi:DNA-binding transcriptional LysR family regulator
MAIDRRPDRGLERRPERAPERAPERRIETWDEVRTAWMVARAGTVSGAAEALGVHHATVIRHIDALEARLGVKLFQRHPRGYTPTEAGAALAQVGGATDERFGHLAARLSGIAAAIEGDLIVTTLPELTGLILPALAALRAEHPALRLILRVESRILRLEYGEAHVAIRAGARPEAPDAVVQPLTVLQPALYAHPDYLARHGTPETDADLARHHLLGPEDPESRPPFYRWLLRTVPSEAIICRSDSPTALVAAVRAGLGLGFMMAPLVPADLVQVMPPRPDWEVPLWLVSHVDLHRTAKVQAALAALKAGFAR